MRVSIVGQFRTFNLFSWALCAILIIPTLSPGTAEAKRKRHKFLKPVVVRDVYVDVRNIFDPTVPGENTKTIVFDSTGTALQDAAAAVLVYEKAIRNGIGFLIR